MPWLSGHEEVDAEDIRIAGCSGAAYVLWLLVKADGHDATYDTRMDSVLWQAVFKKIDESPLH